MRGGRLALAGVAIAIAACGSTPPVAVERSEQSVGRLTEDREPSLPDIDAERPPTADDVDGDVDLPPVADQPESTLAWGDCTSFGIPSVGDLGTARWECATLSVPMDPFAGSASTDPASTDVVDLALTRHSATGDRRGSILVNPGGPGGDGLMTAWALRNELSATLLRSFDLVSWDPRGTGQSAPRIDCDDEVPPGDPNFIARCVELTGPLSSFLSAPYSASDMEAIRVALGEEQLNFLGYSYGALLGATYAAEHPDRVGGFVLDGATDPRVGGPEGPSNDGFPTLADDGFDAARKRFVELCNATDRCLFSLDAATVLDDLAVQVAALPTRDFDRPPDRLDTSTFDEVIETALTYAGDWELVATALSDADKGDASALAALAAGPGGPDGPDGPDVGDGDDGTTGQTDFSEANLMIYCADLGAFLTDQSFCDAMPTNAETLQPVRPVQLDREVLVIGTEYDPLTPGYHAPDFAAALGDAVHLIWEGVGHTAYPGWTTCIDDAVEAQFLGQPLPDDGTRCTFLFGVDDDVALADRLFGHGDVESDRALRRRLIDEFDEREAACRARALNQRSDQVISHVILDVTSPVASDALDSAASAC